METFQKSINVKFAKNGGKIIYNDTERYKVCLLETYVRTQLSGRKRLKPYGKR